MSDHCVFVDDASDIRQGDVIRRLAEFEGGVETWGFIITADCDIAQNKAGGVYTWLEIIRSHQYLDQYWAPEQLRRLVQRQCKVACDGLNGLLKKYKLELNDVNHLSLATWLAESQPEEIFDSIGAKPNAANNKLLTVLHVLRIALGHDGSNSELGRLHEAWSLLGRDEKNRRAAIREAFDADRGFPDFVLIPELPATQGYGYVILLRTDLLIETMYNNSGGAT